MGKKLNNKSRKRGYIDPLEEHAGQHNHCHKCNRPRKLKQEEHDRLIHNLEREFKELEEWCRCDHGFDL